MEKEVDKTNRQLRDEISKLKGLIIFLREETGRLRVERDEFQLKYLRKDLNLEICENKNEDLKDELQKANKLAKEQRLTDLSLKSRGLQVKLGIKKLEIGILQEKLEQCQKERDKYRENYFNCVADKVKMLKTKSIKESHPPQFYDYSATTKINANRKKIPRALPNNLNYY